MTSSSLAETLQPNPVLARRKRAAARAMPVATEPCELLSLEPRTVLTMRFRSTASDLPRGFFHRYAAMMQYSSEHGQAPASEPFAIYDNNDGNAADVEAGFTIQPGMPASSDMRVVELPAMTVATLTHVGPYSKIEPTYFKLLEWMHERGLTRAGRFMEVYLNSPVDTTDAELRTQIMVPVTQPSANDQ